MLCAWFMVSSNGALNGRWVFWVFTNGSRFSKDVISSTSDLHKQNCECESLAVTEMVLWRFWLNANYEGYSETFFFPQPNFNVVPARNWGCACYLVEYRVCCKNKWQPSICSTWMESHILMRIFKSVCTWLAVWKHLACWAKHCGNAQWLESIIIIHVVDRCTLLPIPVSYYISESVQKAGTKPNFFCLVTPLLSSSNLDIWLA